MLHEDPIPPIDLLPPIVVQLPLLLSLKESVPCQASQYFVPAVTVAEPTVTSFQALALVLLIEPIASSF